MQTKAKEALTAEIVQFTEEALKMHIVQVLADSYTHTNLFDYNLDSDGTVIWYKAQARQLWDFWRAAKAQATPEWISVDDRMPDEGEEVLVHSFGTVRQATRSSSWAGGFKERNCRGWQAAYSQSHWMPISVNLPKSSHFYYKHDAKVAKEKSHDRSKEAKGMNLEKERKAFESSEFVKTIIHKFEWSDDFNNYQIKDCVINGNVFDHIEAENDRPILNGAWFGWQAAKAQSVPEALKKFCNEHKDPAWRGRLTEYDKGYSDCCIAVLEMTKAQEQK